MEEYKYYIAGEFKGSAEKKAVINPFTEEAFAQVFETTNEDLTLAIQKAKAAGQIWRQASFKERAKALREIAKCIYENLNVLAQLETQEIGKPFKESLFVDIQLGADCFNYYANFLENLEEESLPSEYGIDLVKYEPFGVCGVYLPYNVPLMIFGFTCAGALAAGNSLIIKPSEFGSLSMLELAKYLDKLDLPKGLINVVTGKGETVGKSLASANIDLISFTGSRNAVKKIITASAENPKKIICELGGANISAVFADSDKEAAMQNILAAAFMKQGQTCIGTSFILIQEQIYKDFINDFINRVKKIKVGDPNDSDCGLGPLPSKFHLERVANAVKQVEARGGKILGQGSVPAGKGFFYPATVIEVDKIVYEELFAPVVLVKSFKDKIELEKIIQDNPAGLVLQLWTKDLGLANDLAAKARAGTVWINTFVQMNSQTPFGGMGQSGWGRNLGKFGFFEYIQPKHIGIGFKPSPVVGWFGV